jgi:hypothetical protein
MVTSRTNYGRNRELKGILDLLDALMLGHTRSVELNSLINSSVQISVLYLKRFSSLFNRRFLLSSGRLDNVLHRVALHPAARLVMSKLPLAMSV